MSLVRTLVFVHIAGAIWTALEDRKPR